MQSTTQAPPTAKTMLWTGYILSTLPVLMLLMSAVMKCIKSDEVVKGFEQLGWDARFALGLGIVEIVCTVLYVIPRTAVLGAILLTGYLGGAIATHLRISEQFIGPLVLGVLIWGGLWLRDAEMRTLVPWRG